MEAFTTPTQGSVEVVETSMEVVEASKKVVEVVEASTEAVEASTEAVEAFMETVEASMKTFINFDEKKSIVMWKTVFLRPRARFQGNVNK